MNKDYAMIEIIEDGDDIHEEELNIKDPKVNENLLKTGIETNVEKKVIKKRAKPVINILDKYYNENPEVFEIGVDEAGRGPLFGRVYSGAVILPKDDSFDHSRMKDSKKFHSKTKIEEVAEYIKENAIAWGVGYESEQVIDNINILQATQQSMHKAIDKAISKVEINKESKQMNNVKYQLLIDGNYFKPYTLEKDRTKKVFEKVPYVTVEGGDNTYSSIAAASILAKVARDQYIDELCEQNPYLSEYYGIDSNKGYGAKRHMDGIKEHGITVWHRRTFGICKNY